VFGEVRNSTPVPTRPPLRSWSAGGRCHAPRHEGLARLGELMAGNDIYDFNATDRIEAVFESSA